MTNGNMPTPPEIRWLRAIAAAVFIGLIVYIVFDQQPDNLGTLGTLAGLLLVMLGFEGALRWFGRK